MRLIVLELNELPPRVLRWWGQCNPSSQLWSLAQRGQLVETVLDEELPRDMYPSQSWASVGMGSPWTDHRVFWYGDPKPADHLFYWQRAAAEGRSVGLVGVLHSSPVHQQCQSTNFRFVMPDVFSEDASTIPENLEPLQELNLRLSQRSARVASTRFSPADFRATLHFARQGVRFSTWLRLAQLAGSVVSGRWNKERLRVGQSLLLADVFEKQIQRHDTDLSIFFSNHIASAMHRYWAATFPEDWQTHPYGDNWIEEYGDELPFAMRAADRMVGRLQRLASASGRELIVISSMGQRADLDVKASSAWQVVVRDPAKLLAALACPFDFDLRAAMVPQISVTLADATAADAFAAWLRKALPAAAPSTMVADDVVTFACELQGGPDGVEVADRTLQPEEVGVTIEAISDHRSGRHDPRGVLITAKDTIPEPELDALKVSEHVLDLLGVSNLAVPS